MKIQISNTLWQIGTGDNTRNYFNVFLEYGVALVGPGNPGREGHEKTANYYNKFPKIKNWGEKLKQIEIGDWVIGRMGKTQVLGVGQVVGTYEYSNLFEDIEGWDLQHFIHVRWFFPENKDRKFQLTKSKLAFNTLSKCYNEELLEKIKHADFKEYLPIEKKWRVSQEITLEYITDSLIEYGIRILDAENIANTIKRIIKLTTWYIQNDPDALEHEIRAFLIVPFLISLGWSEQKMKLEYNRIDLALFREPYIKKDKNKTPHLILEAKAFENGLAFTGIQVSNYGKKFPDCEKFVITNGFRYRYFEKENGELKEKGYFNLLQLREKYAIKQIHPNYYSTIETILKIANIS